MTSHVGCAGDFAESSTRGQPIQTHGSAKPFYIFDPRPEDISLEVIAHALSLQCRFGGHCGAFYSVAQHCVLASRLCPSYPAEALMHDAAEAYIGDIVRPLKIHLSLYKDAEKRLEAAIAQRFGLTYPWPAEVIEADIVMLATEKRDLLVPNDADWGPMPKPREKPITPWAWEEARARFLSEADMWGLR